jgi:hypothetical protein
MLKNQKWVDPGKLRWRVPKIADGQEVVVVVFDMCSSTRVIEALTHIGRVHLFKDFLSEFKHHLASVQQQQPFLIYKFVGDGWLLLYPAARTDGALLLDQLAQISRIFAERFKTVVLGHLSKQPQSIGLTFGIDVGPLVHTIMYGQNEYIGRAINVAARLQGATKDIEQGREYSALMTNNFHQDYLAKCAHGYPVRDHLCLDLKLQDGDEFSCKAVNLLVELAKARSERLVKEVELDDADGPLFSRASKTQSLRFLDACEEPQTYEPQWLPPLDAARTAFPELMHRLDHTSGALASLAADLADQETHIKLAEQGEVQDSSSPDLDQLYEEFHRSELNHEELAQGLNSIRQSVTRKLEAALKEGVMHARGFIRYGSPSGVYEIAPSEWRDLSLDIELAHAVIDSALEPIYEQIEIGLTQKQ